MKTSWISNKRKLEVNDNDSDDSSEPLITKIPLLLNKSPNSYIYSNFNHIYFKFSFIVLVILKRLSGEISGRTCANNGDLVCGHGLSLFG